jgi:hypothetical protein
VSFVKVKVPYPMPPAVSEAKREEFMAWALRQRLPRLEQQPFTDRILTIVGYGPSLEDTWRKVRPPLICTSNSLKFLLGKGLKPGPGWFYAMADPRPNNLDFIRNPVVDGVVYLMASVCHPKVWKILHGQRVILWHAISGEHTPAWVEKNDPGQWLVGAGSTVGLCSIHLGGFLGFRKFELHGFDGSFRDGRRHAGEHNGHEQAQVPSTINPAYMTSKIMDNANVEVQNTLRSFPIFCVFHGQGLMQDWIGKADLANAALDGTAKADSLRQYTFSSLSKDAARVLQKAGVPVL